MTALSMSQTWTAASFIRRCRPTRWAIPPQWDGGHAQQMYCLTQIDPSPEPDQFAWSGESHGILDKAELEQLNGLLDLSGYSKGTGALYLDDIVFPEMETDPEAVRAKAEEAVGALVQTEAFRKMQADYVEQNGTDPCEPQLLYAVEGFRPRPNGIEQALYALIACCRADYTIEGIGTWDSFVLLTDLDIGLTVTDYELNNGAAPDYGEKTEIYALTVNINCAENPAFLFDNRIEKQTVWRQ